MENIGNDDQSHQPLLSPEDQMRPRNTVVFTTDSDDIAPITGPIDFLRQFSIEAKKLWYLAGPAIFTSLCQYSLGAITQLFAGHVSTIALAAVSIENSVIAGFCFGIMIGMGSALETLCGQAYGAGKPEMLGVYMQRSWIILNTTALLLSLLYVFARQILKAIGETTAIAEAAGVFALYMIPQLFAYSMNFPIQKFLQAQSKMMIMAWTAAVALVAHAVLSWVLMLKLGWGLVGAAAVLNAAWWFMVVVKIGYVVCGYCGKTWSGFSFQAFQNLWAFLRLSFTSAIMLCLEVWYFMALILIAGYLKNAEVSVDAMSICMNILGWMIMLTLGMNAAVSVRVSNELGARHPRTAKFAIAVAVITTLMVSFVLSMVLVIFRKEYPSLFTTDEDVKELVIELTPMLALCIIINNVQPVLSGVAVGAGWQATVAYVNITCYYLIGVPLGLFLGFKLDLGVIGIWSGMMSGTILQSCVLFFMVYKTNWNKEASLAEDRIKKWGGSKDSEENLIAN
ncbi:protein DETOXIFICATION 29-like [Arachis duranensis]|uniref:Protein DETOXIFICATION n=1 Tax=Arachis duranensis TaxID=130453 RepID=A0A6P4DET9_ARADU|nr:protein DETOXIFICATION 29-like [Arachis duranensis]